MRRAAIGVLLIAACAAPVGADRSGCGPEWLDVEPVVTSPRGGDERPVPIDCMHQIANRRLRVGFALPAGPSCHLLHRVELIESADAVSITLFATVDDDPAAGACPDEPRRVVTEIDLAAPIGDRTLLDGSGAAE
jgi:hypothetical protein